ncbi:MAG: hypothetical protein ACFFEN_17795 [Candidatus Thorarchaeota archaeon]
MIIITGFGPYGQFKKNLSAELVKKLNLPNYDLPIYRKILPVSWNLSITSYNHLLINLDSMPEVIILFGIHSHKLYHIEKYGWNFALGNDIENKWKMGLIQYKLSFRLKTTINVEKLFSNLKNRENISISNWAGTYLCNYLYYWALKISNKQYPVIFIHIPYKENLRSCIKKVEMIIQTIIKVL